MLFEENMNFKLLIIFTHLLIHQISGSPLTTSNEDANQDEIELYRQLFLRLNTIMKNNIEIKGDVQELKDAIMELKQRQSNNLTSLHTANTPNCPIPSTTPTAYINSANAHCFGNNWITIQRRFNGSENFDRSWNEYKNGFGNVEGEFFIGLDKLAAFTQAKPNELLIVLKDFDNNERYARYDNFRVGYEIEQYELQELGLYKGSAGDSLGYHKGAKFTTKDSDNDDHPTINCSEKFGGGWWYRACHNSNLNGHYIHTDHDRSYASGIHWKTFRDKWYSLKYAEMMIRPKSASGRKDYR